MTMQFSPKLGRREGSVNVWTVKIERTALRPTAKEVIQMPPCDLAKVEGPGSVGPVESERSRMNHWASGSDDSPGVTVPGALATQLTRNDADAANPMRRPSGFAYGKAGLPPSIARSSCSHLATPRGDGASLLRHDSAHPGPRPCGVMRCAHGRLPSVYRTLRVLPLGCASRRRSLLAAASWPLGRLRYRFLSGRVRRQ